MEAKDVQPRHAVSPERALLAGVTALAIASGVIADPGSNAADGSAPIAVGQSAPNCLLTAWDSSDRFGLQNLDGQAVYIDFWASWCVPCAHSFAFMNSLHDEFHERGLRIIAVNLDEKIVDARAFLVRHPARFEIATTDAAQCAYAFGVAGMPSTYVVDRAGNIRHVHVGFRADDAASLREAVERVVDDPSAAR
jgi:peroxiredoxin